MLQNWIENKQISLLKLQEIIQKEEERRKKSVKIVLKPNFYSDMTILRKKNRLAGFYQ